MGYNSEFADGELLLPNIDEFVKSLFVNDFEHFGEKALMMFSVKNVPLKRDLRALARVLVF